MGLVLLSSSSSVYFSLIVFFFFLTDIIGISGPDGLSLVKLFIFGVFFLNCLFLFLVFIFIGILILSYILNLWFFAFFFIVFLFLLFFVIGYFFVTFLFDQEFDWVSNELGVLLDDILNSLFFNIVSLIFFQVQYDLCSSSNRFSLGIRSDGE